MSKKLTTTQFIEKSRLVHGNRYDYSLVNYTGIYTKIIIVCHIHGEFLQKPSDHLNCKIGCKKCSLEQKRTLRSSTSNRFIEKARLVHGNKYNYSLAQYNNNKTKVKIICPMHGQFLQTPNNHLTGYGCSVCGVKQSISTRTFSTEHFIKKARLVHGNKYNYSKVEYIQDKIKVKIICPVHGDFLQRPNNHLYSNQGCPGCKIGGTVITQEHENTLGFLYLARFFNKKTNEIFIKVGITTQTPEKRLYNKTSDYSVNIITSKNISLYEAYKTEQYILTRYQKFKYVPTLKFDGHTECLDLSTMDEIQNIISQKP